MTEDSPSKRPRRRPSSRIALFGVLLATLVLTACGYTTRSLVSDQYRTIAVPVFENETDRHDLEWEVTRAVVEEVRARTHLSIVTEGDQPDLVLRGKLVDATEQSIARRKFQRPRDAVYFASAAVSVTNGRTGEVVVSERKVTERESFSPVIGENVRTARQEAVRSLAERIVRTLEEGW